MQFKVDWFPELLLKRAGYAKHYRGWVKYIGEDRFHAFVVNGETIDIHYDKDQGGYHSAAPKIHIMGREKGRIKSFEPGR